MDEQLLAGKILAERVPKSHPSWSQLTVELKNSMAGIGGEARVLSLLERELEVPGGRSIFSDIYIPNRDGFAQVDFLIVCKEFICVVEVKNMKGDFYFDSSNFQFHRLIDGRWEGMRNPESQLHRAVKATEKFLGVPVHGVIVLASRSARVVEGPEHYPVVSLDYLPFHIEGLAQGGKLYDDRALAAKLRALPKQNFHKNLLERHQISVDALRMGVTCPACRNVALTRKDRKWHCTGCKVYFRDAHEVALQEYAVLFGAELPTKFAYRWLGVEDKYTLYRLLEKSALQGNERGKRWIVPRRELLEAYFGAIYR